MSDKIQRKIKWGDAQDRTDRKPAQDAQMGIGSRRPIQWDHVTWNAFGFFRRHSEGLNGPIHFPPGVRDRLSRFSGHYAGEFLTAIMQRSGDFLQKMVASVRRKVSHRLGCVGRRLDRCLGIGLARLRDFGKDFPGEGIVYRSGCVPLAPLAADEKWTWSLQEDAPLLEEGLRRGLDGRCWSRFYLRRLFRGFGLGHQVFRAPIGDSLDRERFIRRDSMTTRTIGHRHLAIESFRKTGHADPERRFPFTLWNRPKRLCIRHTVILRKVIRFYLLNTAFNSGSGLGTRHLREHAIDFLGEGVKWKSSGNRNSRILLRGPCRRLHQDEPWCPVESPPIRLLTVLKNRFQVAPFVETLSELGLIQANGFGKTLECTGIQSAAFAKQPIMHGPIASLRARTTGCHCRLDSNSAVRSRIVAVHEFDLPGIDVCGLQPGQGFLKELQTIAAGKVRIFDQCQWSIGAAPDTSVILNRSGAGFACT